MTKYLSIAGCGVDVSSQRVDDVEKRCLADLQLKTSAKVLDLGAGLGGQSVRMVHAGAHVTAVDSFDFSVEFAELRKEHHCTEDQLAFVHSDVQSLLNREDLGLYSDAVFQRTVHYLPYTDALRVLQFLFRIVTDKLYISVTGLQSAIGQDYAGATLPVADRFFSLTPELSETFSIIQPVCLYTKSEFVHLLETAGWKVDSCWVSAFGNIKAVCAHV